MSGGMGAMMGRLIECPFFGSLFQVDSCTGVFHRSVDEGGLGERRAIL